MALESFFVQFWRSKCELSTFWMRKLWVYFQLPLRNYVQLDPFMRRHLDEVARDAILRLLNIEGVEIIQGDLFHSSIVDAQN